VDFFFFQQPRWRLRRHMQEWVVAARCCVRGVEDSQGQEGLSREAPWGGSGVFGVEEQVWQSTGSMGGCGQERDVLGFAVSEVSEHMEWTVEEMFSCLGTGWL
jgi:hypothetical protein